MTVYLRDIPLVDAQALFWRELEAAGLMGILDSESIPLDEDANGRVLAEPVWAKISSPHYHASAMDGFAVRSSDTTGAQPSHPITLRNGSSGRIASTPDCRYLDTGDPVPAGYDAVIPVELTEPLGSDGEVCSEPRKPSFIRIRNPITPWSHVRLLGEDIVASQLILASGHILRPADLSAIAAAGHGTVLVSRKPCVGIIPTGNELVPVGTPVKDGDIYEFNSISLAAQINAWGGVARRYPITPDDFDAIADRTLEAAAENDLVLINAGSSAGSEDFSARIVESLGTIFVHGVAIRPGHPIILGFIDLAAQHKPAGSDSIHSSGVKNQGSGKIPVIGVPGYPVSAAMTGDLFVEPLLANWTGRRPLEAEVVKALLTRKITSPAGDDDYIRVTAGRVRGNIIAAPLSRGAGVITSLVRADGYMVVPRGIQGVEAGGSIDVHLTTVRSDLDKTIFCVGSHDLTLDLVAEYLTRKNRKFVSVNVGSQAGLIAMGRGESHMAGSHLLDPLTGVYNISSIKKYLAGIPVQVFGFVGREQGLIISRGNPKGIKGLESVTEPGIIYVNRQRGAGTRVLLEYLLAKMGIAPEGIKGYNQEEYTHLGVAAAVASHRADCGLGIPAAAQALNLDFIPIAHETYQVILRKEDVESELLRPFLMLMADPEFLHAVRSLPGYTVDDMGKLIAEV